MSPPRPSPTRAREAGYSLVIIVGSLTIMLILMAAAVPTWRYVMKDSREEELIFRGNQIADAIARYQKKNANALPTSIEVLVKGKYLRKAYKDPLTADGKWRLVRQGEAIAPGGASPAPGRPGASPSPPGARPGPLGPVGTVGQTLGGFIGVASTSTEKGLRLFNGRERYNEWIFAVGQPRVVGRQQGPLVPNPIGPLNPSPSARP